MWRWSPSPFPLKHESPEGAFIKANKEISKEKIPFFNVVTRIISRLVWPAMWTWLLPVSHRGTGARHLSCSAERRLPWQQPLGSSCWWSQKCSISSLLLMAYVFFVELLLIQHILSPKQTLIKASFSTQGSSWISILNFLTRAVDLVIPLFTR